MPELLAQLTDLHVQVGPGDALASERVAEAIGLVSRVQPRPDAVLLTGDLVNTGTAAEYERLAEVLAPLLELGIPVLPLVGNHDDRELLRATLGGAPSVVDLGSERHLQYAFTVGGLRVLALDTQHTGHDDGKYCDTRLAWLAGQLEAAPDVPTLLAMHHPPIPVGLPNLDVLAVRPDHALRLGELLARHPQVLRVACGHVHRGAVASLAGIPVFACPSVFLPARPDLHPGPPLTLVDGPVGAALHIRTPDGGLASHVRVTSPEWLAAPSPERPPA